MQRMIGLALLLGCPVTAFGVACSAGYKPKEDLTGLTCRTSATDAASCNSNCCTKDKLTCGGIDVTCAWDSYATLGDAWAKTATTKTTKTTDCCTKRPTCKSATGTYTCPAGQKQDAAKDSTKCATDAASCADDCCTSNTKTCGGFLAANLATACPAKSVAFPFNMYLKEDTTAFTATTAGEMDATWKKMATDGTAADFKKSTKCCGQVRAMCSSTMYSCPAGYKKKAKTASYDPNTKICNTDAKSCALTSLPANNNAGAEMCCEKDAKKCLNDAAKLAANSGDAKECATGTEYPSSDDAWKNTAAQSSELKADGTAKEADGATAKERCCTAKVTCKDYTCTAGSKMKAGVEKTTCNSYDMCQSPCCENDNTKCGGLAPITCAYGFYSEMKEWGIIAKPVANPSQAVRDVWSNKPATLTTKDVACCTAKAMCSGAAAATTTPAATVTPASLVRRYSEHKVRKSEVSDRTGSNMVWLGVGALAGVAVVAAVQGLRSKFQADPALE